MSREQASAGAEVGCDPVLALKALAHPLRFRLFTLLASGEKCVCDLVDGVDASQPLVSHHLSVLKKARLVTDRQDATWNYYSIDTRRWNEVRDALLEIQPSQAPAAPCPPEDPAR
ncbi:MAG: ArsR/SmtB family transcription factor [Rubrobacter sp.]